MKNRITAFLLFILVIFSFITMSIAMISTRFNSIKEDAHKFEYVENEKEVIDLANMGSRYRIESRDERRMVNGMPASISIVIYIFFAGILIFLSNIVTPILGLIFCFLRIIFDVFILIKK